MLAQITVFILAALLTSPAMAGTSEAREVARLNNCTPKKVEVFQNSLGGSGKTVYQVSCTLPKSVGSEEAKGPDALLIGCAQSLCELIRPISIQQK